MSEFLVIKSAQEQREDGVGQPVDTAYIGERNGMPVLKAAFDVHHFKTNDIELCVENDELSLEAVCTEVNMGAFSPVMSPFSPLETISTSLLATLHHHFPVPSASCNVSSFFSFAFCSL